jgi:lysophospholipase L1-like esterase
MSPRIGALPESGVALRLPPQSITAYSGKLCLWRWCRNKTFDERQVGSQYQLMRARCYWGATGLALASLVVLHLVVSATGAGEQNQSPEARWGKEIRAFEEADRTNPPPRQAILFIGSSSIRYWTNIAEAFPGHKVISRGFDGSHLSDSVAFVDRFVTPYKPRLVLLYAGDNDIASDMSPEQVLGDFKVFAGRIHAALPNTSIAYLAIKPCPARENLLDRVKATNGLIREYAASNDRLLYVDTFAPMLANDGRPRADVYLADALHLNARGYEIWVSILRPILDKYDPLGTGGK